MIPYKFNPLGISNKKLNNISSFKIQGDSLILIFITPVEDCVVDFGDGTKQTYTGNNKSTRVIHSYSESNIYTIKIIGNHSNFRAPTETIEIIQISNSITYCSSMFRDCSSLTTIPSTLTIPNSVTDCSYMFDGCSSLTTIPETFIIPNSVIDCIGMFRGCSSLTAIPSTLTIPNSVDRCSYMFSYCRSLTSIPSTLTIPNSVADCSDMFSNCSSLTEIPETFTIPDSVKVCAGMFRDCLSLTSDISNIWPSTWNFTGTINISYMFYNCVKVVGIVPADKLWNSRKKFTSSYCFYNCTSLSNYDEIPYGWQY